MRFIPPLAAVAALACAAPALAEPPRKSDAIKQDDDPYMAGPSRAPASVSQAQEQTTQPQTRLMVQVDGDNVVISNQPVPDTVVNRERYGQPLSRAGRRSAPNGD